MSQPGLLLRVGLERARQDASSRWSVERLRHHPLRRLARVEGRVEQALHLPQAGVGPTVDIHPNLVHALLERLPTAGRRLSQEAPDAPTVRLAGRRGAGGAAPLIVALPS